MLDLIQPFHFLRPWWWLALPAALLLIWLLAKSHRQGEQWSNFIAPQLLPYLLDGKYAAQRRNLIGWLLVPLILTITALAGPVWQQLPQSVERNSAAVVICWDLSPSMLAEDIKPSRLERSRLKIIDLLKSRKDGLTGFIAYSGEAYVVAPLTEDVETIINLLPSLGPTTLPTVGSNPEMAMTEAIKLLRAAGASKGDLLFLTDGIDPKAFANLQEQLGKTQDRISIWGVGGKEGAPIPLPRGGFLKEGNNPVLAKINEDEMRQFASANRGYYLPLQATDADIKTLSRIFEHKDQNQLQTDRHFDQWFEAGQYLVLGLLPLCLLLFRRGWLLAVLIFIPLFSPAPAQALGWQDLWQTPDQQGAKLLLQGDAKTAADRFEEPRWKATAQYKSRSFDAAAQTFKQNGDADSLYNAGNAYTQAGRFDDAIKAYDQALAKNPQLSDATANKKIAQQLKDLAAKQKQQDKSKDKSKDNKDSSGDQQNKDQQGDDQKKDGDKSSDSSEQDGKQSDAEQKQEKDKKDGEQNTSKDQQNSDAKKDSDSKKDSDPKKDSEEPKDDVNNNQSPEQEAENKAKREAAAKQQAQIDKEKQAQAEKENKEEKDAKVAAQEAAEAANADDKKPAQVAAPSVDKAPQTEDQQKMEQWLKRVPDDPSGLMRNKFKYQYQERRQHPQGTTNTDNNPESRW